jgi:hypothetical protein
MLKTIAVILVASLLLPQILFAAPSNEVRPSASGESPQSPSLPKVDPDPDYHPVAKKIYLGTGIGTLVTGVAFVALGIRASNEHEIGSEAAGTVLTTTGGIFLAASTVLWVLYFREKMREPATSVGLELGEKKAVVLANYRF